MADTRPPAGGPDTVLVSRGPGETRYALLAGENVIEVAIARDGELMPGAVIAGRAGGSLPGAVFIDIGDAVPGVLRVKTPLPQGRAVAVRVIVPARADKGAELKLADDVTLPEGVKGPAETSPAPDTAQGWWNRYHGTLTDIVCAPASELGRLRPLLGGGAPLKVFTGDADLFEAFGVDDAMEAVLEPAIALPCGGRVMIETAAGATVIDVDAGPALPATANEEAIHVIAGALRLRNIGGHILIDMIPPARGRRADLRAAARGLADRLAGVTAADPVATEIAGVTPLGMIELTRRRVGLSLGELLAVGDRKTATLAYAVLRRAVRVAHQAKAARVVVTANAEVATLLKGRLHAALKEAAARSNAEIIVRERPGAVDVTPG